MRVLQICHCYYPPFLDCARQYAALFKGTDVQVTTVYLTGKPDIEVERASESDEVIFLGYKSKDVSGLKLGAIRKIKKLASKRHFSFCITHRAKPTYVALLATSLPVISVRHNFGDFDRFARRIMVNLFRKRLLLLGVSNAVRDEMRAKLPHWPQAQIETLYNRIDVEAVQSMMMSKEAARLSLKIPTQAWVIANVGRLHRDKDQATLIRAYAKSRQQLPENSLLLIVGSGPLEQKLKDLVTALDLTGSVIFSGQVEDARRFFKAFDVFVLSSDHEPFGMVLLEALAAELPIICSDCGGGAEVTRGAGELFPFGDETTLAARLIKLSQKEDPEKGPALIAHLRENFSDQSARKRFWQLFNLIDIFKNSVKK